MDLEDGSLADIPTRPMRVKILYTFDQDSKTNCLARIPDVLNIPAVAIDETSQVGVIELKQCIQAIVSASPEIVSRLSDGDFTIYAYDYSEYDTPIVGQGMLSAALVASTPAGQGNKAMITGRVCKNMLALFSNGVKETLEVKLRLVPVPKPAQAQQNDFAKGMNMDGVRSMSPAVSTGFDPNAWNQTSKSQQQQMNDYFNFDAMPTTFAGSERDNALLEDIFGPGTSSSGSGGSGHQLAGGVGIAETPTDPFNPAFSHSAPGSRAGSPMIPPEHGSRNDMLRHQSFSGHPSNFGGHAADNSRPGSRASVRSEVDHHRQASTPTLQHPQPRQQHVAQQQTEVYYNEDGQARKRAKVTQTDWRGRSLFGSKSADLRVTAATAASMHMHRPIAKRPAAPGSNLEPPPRVPTPVPQINPLLPQQQIAPRRSLLRQASVADSDFMSDADNFSDALISSPEEGDESPGNSIAAEGTPQEIPSSPPVFPDMNLPQPSSPGLPTLPPPGRLADSGYMSDPRGFGSNVVESLERDEADRSPDDQDYEMAASYKPRKGHSKSRSVTGSDGLPPVWSAPPTYPSERVSDMDIQLETPGDMNQLPSRMLLNLPPPRKEREGSQGPSYYSTSMKRPAGTPGPMQGNETMSKYESAPAPSEAGSRRGSVALPPKPVDQPSDPNNPAGLQKPQPKKRQSMQRSRTSSNGSEAGSPAPSDNEGPNGRPKGNQRSGSGAQRRKIIEQRLQASIAKGETPQYCSHCGAIETPTWRKLYVKECEGKPSPLDSAEGEGETVGVAVTHRDPITSEPTRFVIRKSMKKTKESQPGEGFVDKMVCNPCGLWFNKFKNMRPPDKWGRRSGTRRPRKPKSSEGGVGGEGDFGMSTDGIEPQSEAFFTDQVGPDDAGEDGDVDGEGQVDGADEGPSDQQRILAPAGRRPRANSLSTQELRRGHSHGQWNASQLDAALTRAIQSSPVRFHGSQQSPIEADDLTPRPTRRLLFPSPRKEGDVKSLDDNAQVSLKAMPPAPSPGKVLKDGVEITFDHSHTSVFEAFTFDKENLAPGMLEGGLDADDELARLFENGTPGALFKTPFKTPRKTPRSHGSRSAGTPRNMQQLNHLLKTPTPGRSGRRKPLTPNANAANGADLNAGPVNDFMTSPSSSRYFLRSTPSRISRNNTPGRQGSGGNGMSPFSLHLAQMLSDAPNADGSQQFTSSPSRGMAAAFDFSDLPTFSTPGRPGMLTDADWEGLEGIMSSEFPTDGFEEGSGL